MNKQQIVSVLAELHKISGFRVSLHDTDYSEIAAYPAGRCSLCSLIHTAEGEYDACVACDKAACKKALELSKTYIYECRHGLTEAVSPLYNFGTLTGFLMMGQIYDGAKPHPLPELKRGAVDPLALAAAAAEVPVVDSEMVESYARIMTICAEYLTLSGAIPSRKPTVGQMAKQFISDNFREKIGIKDVCAHIGCSKSTLITAFKKEFDNTVNSYLNEVRLTEAERMLRGGGKSVGEIAISVGYSDQSYFSKVFSAYFGVPPSEYDGITNLHKMMKKRREEAGKTDNFDI